VLNSLYSADAMSVFADAANKAGAANGPFPSPADWRDQWIYFLMVDLFAMHSVHRIICLSMIQTSINIRVDHMPVCAASYPTSRV